MQTLDNWKLNISNFYPVGLKYHGDDKASMILTWSSNLLSTKKFRTFSNALANNLPPDKDQIRKISDPISEVIVNTLESAILTEKEEIMYFPTPKMLRKADYFGKVKSICTSRDQFVMLEVSDVGNIQITFHPDSFPCQSKKQMRSFDISFDKNFCQATWETSQFKIVALRANPERPEFFNSLQKRSTGLQQYTVDNEFIFFSINNALLTLVIEEDAYSYHQVHTHSSNIRGIHPSKDLNSIYVLLESGIIDVIHSCEILGVIKTSSLYFMNNVLCPAYCICDDVLVYSDGYKIEICYIKYSNQTRNFKVDCKTIPLPGIVALTMVKTSKMVICVSENRIFYKISYDSGDLNDDNGDGGKPQKMVPVDEFLSDTQQTTINIRKLINSYDSAKQELSNQNRMFDALALTYNYKYHLDNSPFRFPLCAKLKIHRTIPDLNSSFTIYTSKSPTGSIDNNGCFLHIQLQPHRFGTELFLSNVWSICVNCATTTQGTVSKIYRMAGEVFDEPLDILVPLESRNHIVPPRVTVDIRTVVKIGEDVVCLTFPVHTEPIDYSDMIRLSNEIPTQTAIQNNTHPSNRSLIYHINVLKNISLAELLGIDPKFQLKENVCYVILFDNFLQVSVDDSLMKISLKSCDASIMFHVKKIIFGRLRSIYNFSMECRRNRSVQKYVVSRQKCLPFFRTKFCCHKML